jgi:hypothetical protein
MLSNRHREVECGNRLAVGFSLESQHGEAAVVKRRARRIAFAP